MPVFDYDGDGDVDFDDVRASFHDAWESFTDFAFRDNVLEVAVGLIFASAFTSVANSLVSDILLPIVSLLPFLAHNMEEKFLILRAGRTHPSSKYNTVQQAVDDGAVVWSWGSFVDKLLRFFIIALAMFLIAKTYSWLTKDNIVRRQVRCKYCRKYISERARRCLNCTSWQDGREDKRPAEE